MPERHEMKKIKCNCLRQRKHRMFDFDPESKKIEIKCPRCGVVNVINIDNSHLIVGERGICNTPGCGRILFEYFEENKILIKCEKHKKWKIVTLLPKIIIEDRTDRSRQY